MNDGSGDFKIGLVKTNIVDIAKDSIILDSHELGNSNAFLALHPLSSTISATGSNFTGKGLHSVNQFDDYFLNTT